MNEWLPLKVCGTKIGRWRHSAVHSVASMPFRWSGFFCLHVDDGNCRRGFAMDRTKWKSKIAKFSGYDPQTHKRWTKDLNQITQVMLPDVFAYLVYEHLSNLRIVNHWAHVQFKWLDVGASNHPENRRSHKSKWSFYAAKGCLCNYSHLNSQQWNVEFILKVVTQHLINICKVSIHIWTWKAFFNVTLTFLLHSVGSKHTPVHVPHVLPMLGHVNWDHNMAVSQMMCFLINYNKLKLPWLVM